MKKSILAACMAALALTTCKNKVEDYSERISFVQTQDGTVYGLQDNEGDKKHPADLFDAPDSVIQMLGLEEGIESSIHTYIVCKDNYYVLIDVGLGEMGHGQLLQNMQELGLEPDTIKQILITHMHGDHIGGLLSEGEPVFKQADLCISVDEYEFWNKEENQLQQAVLKAYAGRIVTFNEEDLLPLGIKAIAVPGHTPGHMAFQYGNVMIIGDAIHGWDLQKEHPEYCARFDMDKDSAIQSRKQLLDYCKTNKLFVGGMHMPKAFIQL